VYWTVAQLQPHHERLAAHCLGLAGFTYYMPRIQPPRKHGSRQAPAPQLLFPGYCFVHIELQWSRAHWCPGILRLLMDGIAPAHVPDVLVAAIRARERNGFVILPRALRLKPGDHVRVAAGLLEGQLGVLVGLHGRGRVEVLLRTLGRTILPATDIEAVG
jgi:transcription antitermination factor NusG